MNTEHPLIKHFARELRRHRESRGWTQPNLADRLEGWREGIIGHIEHGRRMPTLKFATACDRVFGTQGEFEALLRDIGIETEDDDFFQPWTALEVRATILKTYEPLIWPGLLQTEKYAYAVNSAWQVVDAERDPAGDASDRMKRQAIFDRTPPPSFGAIVDESVLYRRIGPNAVMRAQLEHVLSMSERTRVSVQVLPRDLGEHVGLLGAFMTASFDDDTPGMTYLETASGKGDISRDSGTFARMMGIYDALRDYALDVRATRDCMRKAMEERWSE